MEDQELNELVTDAIESLEDGNTHDVFVVLEEIKSDLE